MLIDASLFYLDFTMLLEIWVCQPCKTNDHQATVFC